MLGKHRLARRAVGPSRVRSVRKAVVFTTFSTPMPCAFSMVARWWKTSATCASPFFGTVPSWSTPTWPEITRRRVAFWTRIACE